VTRTDSSTVRRVVVRPPNWLGDAVLALPAMAALRQRFSEAHLAVAAAPSVAALFREETDVRPDRVIELPARMRDAVAVLEGEGFDLGVLFPNSFRSAWITRRRAVAGPRASLRSTSEESSDRAASIDAPGASRANALQ
jgi:heptosyltransferase-2